MENVELTQKQVQVLEDIAKIKDVRKRVDGLAFIVSSQTISPTQSMEKINAHVNLMMVKSWLQEVLETLGEEQINKNEIHTVHEVNDDTDVSDPLKVQVKTISPEGEVTLIDANEIESLNHVRTDVDNILRIVSEIPAITDNIYETFIYQHLKEVKFWMDRQLFFMKKENKRKHFEHANPGIKGQLRTPPVGKKVPLIINKNRIEAPVIEPKEELKEEVQEQIVEEVKEQVKEQVQEEVSEEDDASIQKGKVIQMNQPEVQEKSVEEIIQEETEKIANQTDEANN